MAVELTADPLAALANPRRREILRLVWDGERSAGQIAAAFEVSWPAISQNLRILREAGLVTQRRAGTNRFYSADRKALRPLEAYLRLMWTRDIDRLATLAEAEEQGKSRT